MNLIEHWGSGIPRIIDKVKSAGLRDPEFIGGEVDLRINIYREQNNAISIKNGVDTEKNGIDGVKNGTDGVKNGIENGVDEVLYTDKDLSDHIQKLLKIITKYPTETQAQYAEKLGVSKRTISRIFSELKEQGILEQQGTRRKAKWIISKNKQEGQQSVRDECAAGVAGAALRRNWSGVLPYKKMSVDSVHALRAQDLRLMR